MLEQLKKTMLLGKVRDLFDEAVSADREWQQDARESFQFRDNEQWTKEEMAILQEQSRPHLTFNITKANVDLIMGINEDQRKRYMCTPVSPDDDFKCEVLNNVISYLYDKNEWVDEEDTSFESAVICGRGWTAIDFDIDPLTYDQIKITETNIPIHEVRRDPASRKRDLSDASYVIWDRWLTVEDFVIKYPKLQGKVREAFATGKWPIGELQMLSSEAGNDWPSGDIDDIGDYEDNLDVDFYDSKKRQLRVAHMEYWKNVKKYWVVDPQKQQFILVEKPWKQFKEEFAVMFPGKEMIYESRMSKEIWWIQFSGDEILFHGKSPISGGGFSIIPCFLFGDVSRKYPYHYGIVELMKDAQREINKRVSQVLNLINQQVQPGLFAEPRAFVNKDQAEQSVKEAGSITWLQDGALNNKRFQERTLPSFPAAIMQMQEFAREITRSITGINPDLMGQDRGRQEPGVVVQLRQQQGMTILKPIFKAYETMKKCLFKRQISIITQHMPLKQIIRILGQNDRYQVNQDGTIVDAETKLTCNIKDFKTLDVDIDGEPESASMTENMMELATYTEMQKNGFPVDPTVIISKTKLPASEKIRWIEYIENQQQAESESAQQQMALETQKMEQLHEREMRKLDIEEAAIMIKAENQREKDFIKASIDQTKLTDTKERDMANLKLKVAELVNKVRDGQSSAARELLEMMRDTRKEQRKLTMQLVDTLIKSKKDITVAKIQAIASKEGEKKNEQSATGKKPGKSDKTK